MPTMSGPILDVVHALERARYRGWCARHYEGDNPDYVAQTLSRQRAELDYAIGHLSGDRRTPEPEPPATVRGRHPA
ncbi:MAG TPA: hypothetical protein VFX13_19940 [Gaiellales bacterium]|nr:hypothetical protein [Gaiellales bacterium]